MFSYEEGKKNAVKNTRVLQFFLNSFYAIPCGVSLPLASSSSFRRHRWWKCCTRHSNHIFPRACKMRWSRFRKPGTRTRRWRDFRTDLNTVAPKFRHFTKNIRNFRTDQNAVAHIKLSQQLSRNKTQLFSLSRVTTAHIAHNLALCSHITVCAGKRTTGKSRKCVKQFA